MRTLCIRHWTPQNGKTAFPAVSLLNRKKDKRVPLHFRDPQWRSSWFSFELQKIASGRQPKETPTHPSFGLGKMTPKHESKLDHQKAGFPFWGYPMFDHHSHLDLGCRPSQWEATWGRVVFWYPLASWEPKGNQEERLVLLAGATKKCLPLSHAHSNPPPRAPLKAALAFPPAEVVLRYLRAAMRIRSSGRRVPRLRFLLPPGIRSPGVKKRDSPQRPIKRLELPGWPEGKKIDRWSFQSATAV